MSKAVKKFIEELNKEHEIILGFQEYEKKIADLEAKLAESEEQLKEELVEKKGLERALSACNHQNDEFADMIKKLVNEKEELKQQLAEKDKEIEYYKKQAKKLNNEAQKYFEDAYCNDSIYQDKISFCIEQLEKVKEHNDNLVCDDEDYYNYITAFIDNQIKQLNERK